jgi:protocatechuate 3,4-dioxygenase beta subunit
MRGLLSVVGGAVLLAAAIVCGGGEAFAQAAQKPGQTPQMNMANMDHRGALQGRVRDGSGTAVADATVQAMNQDNGAMFTAMTDAQGNYAFGALPTAKYEVSIARNGLTVYRKRDV